jgi:mannose-6-phosphate isomerase-like protein (cupin superfamily)
VPESGTADPIDLGRATLGIYRDGAIRLLEARPGRPQRIDGLTIGAPQMTHEPPHGGEMHPDGDELLVLISGRVTVVIEDAEPPRRVGLAPGQALVVPRGVWHRVVLDEPSRILHVTPGPGGAHRPPEEAR